MVDMLIIGILFIVFLEFIVLDINYGIFIYLELNVMIFIDFEVIV